MHACVCMLTDGLLAKLLGQRPAAHQAVLSSRCLWCGGLALAGSRSRAAQMLRTCTARCRPSRDFATASTRLHAAQDNMTTSPVTDHQVQRL